MLTPLIRYAHTILGQFLTVIFLLTLKHFLISFNMQAFMSLIDCLANKVPYTIRKTIFYIWSSYYANPGQNNCQKMTCLLAVRHNVDLMWQLLYKLGGSNCVHVRSSIICSLICSHKSNSTASFKLKKCFPILF